MPRASPPADWRRQLGHPHITWLSTVQQDLKQHHLTLPEAADLAQNRPLWRMMSTYGAMQLWVACQKRRQRRGRPLSWLSTLVSSWRIIKYTCITESWKLWSVVQCFFLSLYVSVFKHLTVSFGRPISLAVSSVIDVEIENHGHDITFFTARCCPKW